MRNLNQDNITQAVIARFAATPDARLKVVMTSLVQHLHAFAREVRLTQDEWVQGIQFLTATGQKCDDKRQEFILLSDTLGLSTLAVAMNNDKPDGCTEATVLAPFFVDGTPRCDGCDEEAQVAMGSNCVVRGRVSSSTGGPIADAEIHVWQADARSCGVLTSGRDGRFHLRTVMAQAHAIPTDGPVGELLRATNRDPWRPAHLHFMIKAPGHETLVTHVFRDGDAHLDSDAVFGVRQSLVTQWHKQADGSHALDFEFVLHGATTVQPVVGRAS